jgi:hypothetical protein
MELNHCPSCNLTDEEFVKFKQKQDSVHMTEAKKEDYWPYIYKPDFLDRWVIECKNCGMQVLFNENKAESVMLWNELKR